MMSQNVLLTTSKTLVLELDSSKAKSYLPSCSLQWCNKQLWVKANQDSSQDVLPALKRREWLRECLQNSIVEEVYLDSRLGEAGIELWADVCRESHKKVFLHLPSARKSLNLEKPTYSQIEKVRDFGVSALLLLIFSPVILLIAALIKISTAESIFLSQWRVGNRGKLFQVYNFRTIFSDRAAQLDLLENNPRNAILGKFNLDELLQLFNVLRGEIGLIGSSPKTLSDALTLGKTERSGILDLTGAWVLK